MTNLPSERNAADTTNPEYETFDRSLNVTAGTSEQPEPAFSGSSSDVSYRWSARKDDKGSSIADALNRVPDATGDNNRGNARISIAPKVFFHLCLQSPYQMNYSADARTTTSASAKGSATQKFVAAASLPKFAWIPAAATSPSVRTSSPWRLKAMANTR